MEIVLIVLVLALLASIYVNYNLYRKNNILINLIQIRDSWVVEFYRRIKYISNELKIIDTRGHFEADDEVGFFFKNIKEFETMLSDLVEDDSKEQDSEQK
jgi:hypothetical protein